ncbi:hypothetical protein K443DRAFT_673715 [Laccaria amethystina LaAM-08-1]|uniref:Uncharacterized protein n=1 Tax=Laccaria amethystina LaAM-08-1 TaxID=1095629 RepID=A0A0C9YA86_9AGAR|nr:hypothetical protein K443DRAFT_673715 [Laccaria amethystina LaAM-08-1]
MISKVFGGNRRGAVVAVPSSPPPQPENQRPKRTLPPDLTRWSDFEDPFPSVSMGGYIRYYRSRSNSVKEPSHIPTPSLCCTPPSSQSDAVVPTAPLFPSCSSAASSTKHMEKLNVAPVSSETLSPAINRASPACTSSPTTLPRVNSLRRKRRRLLRTPSIERDFAVSARQLFASHISLSLSTSSSDPHYPASHSPSSSVDSNSSGEESPLTPLSRSSSSSSSSASAKSPTTPTSEKPPVTVVVVGVDDPTSLLITPDAVATEEKGDHARLDVDVGFDFDLLAGRPDTWASYYTALCDFDDI